MVCRAVNQKYSALQVWAAPERKAVFGKRINDTEIVPVRILFDGDDVSYFFPDIDKVVTELGLNQYALEELRKSLGKENFIRVRSTSDLKRMHSFVYAKP